MNFGSINKQINIADNIYSSTVQNNKAAGGYLCLNSLKDDIYAPTAVMSNPVDLCYQTSRRNLYSPRQLLLAYSNPNYVKRLIEINPNINNILSENGLPVKISPKNITNIYNSHIMTTTSFAMQIANKMGISKPEKQLLEQACVFHDFGKILIPSELLEKPDKLTDKEKSIVDLHAQLGYELLSNTGMNNRVLDLIKNHHNPMPDKADVLGQILSVADIYSALREARSYKNIMSEQEAINLLDQKAREGEVSTEVVNALKASLSSAKKA